MSMSEYISMSKESLVSHDVDATVGHILLQK